MADEITVTATLKLSKGFVSSSDSAANQRFDQTGDGLNSSLQNIGITAEAIALGDITTPGYAYFRNTDETNFVQIGQDISGGGFEEFCRLNAGEIAVFRLDLATGGVLQAKADTAPVDLQYTILED
jgi:hypothetical protein